MGIENAGVMRDIWRSLVAAATAAEKTFADKVGPARVRHNAGKALDVAASTVQSFGLDPVTDTDVKYDAVYFTPHAALTANDTDYATLSLVYDAGPGTDVVVATRTTQITGGSGDWVADTPVALTITAANAVVPAGKNLMFKITKAGSGVAVPAGGFNAKGYAQ